MFRDYKKYPLGPKEQMPKEDLEYLYIKLNWCQVRISVFLGNKSCSAVKRMCDKYGFTKTKEQKKISLEEYNLIKYGVKNVALLDSTQEKMKETTQKRYGVSNISFLKTTQEKRKQTCLERYGKDNPAKTDAVKQKIKQTCLEKYGCEHANQSAEIRSKSYKTYSQKMFKSTRGKYI